MINYDPHRWREHFFDIRGSMVREILPRVLAVVIWSAIVVIGFQRGIRLAVPPTLHTLVGTALGLLLVFRTNASYDRFWEGRKLWGGIVNECRNLIRGATAHLDGDPVRLAHLTRWTAAFPFSCMNVLRGVSGLGPAEKYLPAERVEDLAKQPHMALSIAQEMTACLVEARDRELITPHVLVALDQNIQQLVDYLGGCERIRRTPLPFAYVVHLRRALVAYCVTLPFALVESYGWTTLPTVFLVSYVFFGIEEIGVEIEGPFGFDDNDLPLEQICDTIQRNLAQIAGLRLDAAWPEDEDSGSL